jgi:hypothetical protein
MRGSDSEDDRHPGFASAAGVAVLHIGEDILERVIRRKIDKLRAIGQIRNITEKIAGLGITLLIATFIHNLLNIPHQ